MASLAEDYFWYVNAVKNNPDKIDLSRMDWISPTQILLLYHSEKEISNKGVPHNVFSYINAMSNINEIPSGKRYCPIVRIERDDIKRSEEILNHFYEMFDHGKTCGGESAFKNTIGEFIGNIREHSFSQNGYVIGQKYDKLKYVEICILDNGISIPGSYEKHNVSFKDDVDALFKSLSGVSTKELFSEDISDLQRGFGLSVSARIIVEDLNGEMIIVSRKGLLLLRKGDFRYKLLDDKKKFNGTVIAYKVPFTEKNVIVDERRIKIPTELRKL